MSYFGDIVEVGRSILIGMGTTLKYFVSPGTITTTEYKRPERREPGWQTERRATDALGHQHVPVPPAHRGLHLLETEKCIMCLQCAKICPVDCIDIEGTRDGEVEGAWKGDKGAILTRFSIDYSLCIFCNLCCVVCPDAQVCIHMGQEYDLSSYGSNLVRNLLTDEPYTVEDEKWVRSKRPELEKLAEEKKKKAEAKKAAAAKAAPAAKPAGEAKPADKSPEGA